MSEAARPGATGLMTFHRAVNYGAVLQAYALRRCLRDVRGGVCDVIDYRNAAVERAYRALAFGGMSPRALIAGAVNLPVKLRKNYVFRRFNRRFLNIGQSAVKTPAELAALNHRYAAFVTGSDQVWNYDRSGFDRAYFLSFASGRRYAYAASFGFDRLEEPYIKPYRELLTGFERITVREEQGAAIVREQLGLRAEVVLDPTLLLTPGDWAAIAEQSRLSRRLREPYILLYVFELTPGLEAFVRGLSERSGMGIVWVQASLSRRLPRCKRLFTASPEDFVALVDGASAVVTNSFHGTAFAINFEKPLYVEPLPEHYGVNSRILHLLDTLGLSDRLIGVDAPVPPPETDYAQAREKLSALREASLTALSEMR